MSDSIIGDIINQDQARRSLPKPLTISQLSEKYQGSLESLKTGFSSFDRTGAFYRGQVTIFVAETGMGKSLFALNLALRMAKQGHKTLYLDLENGAFQLKDRFEKMGVESDNFHLLPAELAENLMSSYSCLELAKAITRYLDQLDKYDLLVIDPLEVFEPESTKETNYAVLGQVVNHFKQYALKNRSSILVLHHLNKGEQANQKTQNPFNEEEVARSYRVPSLASVGGSGKIVSRATEVLAMIRQMYSPTDSDKSKTLLRVLKSRSGRMFGDYRFHLNLQNLTLGEFVSEIKHHEPIKLVQQVAVENKEVDDMANVLGGRRLE